MNTFDSRKPGLKAAICVALACLMSLRWFKRRDVQSAVIAGGTFGGVLFYGVVSFLLGQLDVSVLYLFRVAALSALYNAILTPLVFPVLRKVVEGSRTHRVVRW